MDTLLRRFSARLHSLRAERNISQEALASRARLDPSFVSALERGIKTPSLTTLDQLARGLQVDIAVLVDFPEESKTRASDRAAEEVALLCRLLKGKDAMMIRKIRKAVEQLVA